MAENLDIANLGTQAIDEGDGAYETASEFYRPVEPGKETVILKEVPDDTKFYPVKDFETQEVLPGFSVNLNFVIQGGAQDGKEFFVFIDTRKKQSRNGNDVKDYLLGLKAAGQPIGNLVTAADYKEAIQTYVAPVTAKLIWTGDKCDCGARRLKMKDFAMKGDGLSREHVTKCQGCGEKVGARIKVAAFIVPDAT